MRAPILPLLALLALGLGCSPAALPALAAGPELRLDKLPLRLRVPAGLERVDSATWILRNARGEMRLAFKVSAQASPPDGSELHLKKVLRDTDKRGEVVVTATQEIPLDDLTGHFVEARSLRSDPAIGLILVVTEAEDGLYTVVAAGALEVIDASREVLRGAVKSLRVDPR